MSFMGSNMSLPKTNCPGVAFNVVWNELYRSVLFLSYLACPADVVVGTASLPEDTYICYTVGSKPALYLYVIQCTVDAGRFTIVLFQILDIKSNYLPGIVQGHFQEGMYIQ
jgi:hypothetical protein